MPETLAVLGSDTIFEPGFPSPWKKTYKLSEDNES